MSKFVKYVHHGNSVWARRALRGKHREHCLCFSCAKFKPEEDGNCDIAQDLFELCAQHGLVTPVYECPIFVPAAAADTVDLTDDETGCHSMAGGDIIRRKF